MVYAFDIDGKKYQVLKYSNPGNDSSVESGYKIDGFTIDSTESNKLNPTGFDVNTEGLQYADLQAWYNSSSQQEMRDGLSDDGCDGVIDVNVAIGQLYRNTGILYSVASN